MIPLEATLRPAADGDGKSLISFLEIAYRQTYFPLFGSAARSAFPDGTWLRDWPRVLHREPGTKAVLAEVSGQIVGFAQTVIARNGEMGTVPSVRQRELQFLYVDAGQYGSGLAQSLLGMVLGDDEPAELWVVEGNLRAIAFYRKNGFAEDGVRFALGNAEAVADGVFEVRMVR